MVIGRGADFTDEDTAVLSTLLYVPDNIPPMNGKSSI
jgi:hypothetical protein